MVDLPQKLPKGQSRAERYENREKGFHLLCLLCCLCLLSCCFHIFAAWFCVSDSEAVGDVFQCLLLRHQPTSYLFQVLKEYQGSLLVLLLFMFFLTNVL